MSIKTVIYKTFNHFEVFDLLRIFNGINILIYYLFILLPNFKVFFSSSGIVDQESFSFYPKSWFFSFMHFDLLMVFLFVLSFVLLSSYILGFYSKWCLIVFFPIHLGFHSANPFIIHEPQQISNLLLLLTLFLPIENKWALRIREDIFPKMSTKESRYIIFMMITYLSLYYFFAGFKKLPDSNWIMGNAVSDILKWPYLGKDNLFSKLLSSHLISKILTYLTLIFEFSFIFLSLTSFRKLLIPSGIIFHVFIMLSMDVGLFFFAMLSWYPLLLIGDEK